jgi:hypothetical protein
LWLFGGRSKNPLKQLVAFAEAVGMDHTCHPHSRKRDGNARYSLTEALQLPILFHKWWLDE